MHLNWGGEKELLLVLSWIVNAVCSYDGEYKKKTLNILKETKFNGVTHFLIMLIDRSFYLLFSYFLRHSFFHTVNVGLATK